MTCDAILRCIDAYLDSELDSKARSQVDKHLSSCPDCRQLLASRRNLSQSIKKSSTYMTAPAGIGVRVSGQPRVAHRRFLPVLLFAGLALAVAAGVLVWKSVPTQSSRMVSILVRDHEKAVGKHHLIDIGSSKLDVISSYLKTKGLSYCRSIKTVDEAGFKLVGVRLDSCERRPVAALVYTRNERMIDLYVTPLGLAELNDTDRGNLHVRSWSDCGLKYWAISDSNSADLELLRKISQERTR